MVTNKTKKNVKFRASRSHGYGSHKKHRGGGHRGGRGRAGTGKRGDSKKPRIWKNTKYFGKCGFIYKGDNKVESVNLKYLEDKIDALLTSKLAAEKGGVYEIDVTKLGFDKVLGYGKISKTFRISGLKFSKDAEEKIKAAGGEAIMIAPVQKKPVAVKKVEEKKEVKAEK